MPPKVILPPASDQRPPRPMTHEQTWQCACGSTLRISTHEERADGPSNFFVQLDPNATHPPFGHSMLPSSRLNWEGLREERGWEREGDVIKCPACVQGRTRDEQRLFHRFQRERVGAEIAARHITRQSGGTIQAEAVFARLDSKKR